MWQLGHKDAEWWRIDAFLIVVLEKTLESPLDGKEIKVVNPAATAKSLPSYPTLCDPVPRILQARTLEWVAISFSNA